MKFLTADLWSSKDPIILFTGNSTLRKDGALVMGRGAALEAKTRYPELPLRLGEKIKFFYGNLGRYGVILDFKAYPGMEPGQRLGVFQVKTLYSNSAELELIEYSCEHLVRMIEKLELPVSMNFPGIGFGNLSREFVLPIVSKLPDLVTIYEKEN